MRAPRHLLLIVAALLLIRPFLLEGQSPSVDRELEEAKALYREAKFAQAIAKLQAVVTRLEQLQDLQVRRAQLADAYLHLALSYVALNDPAAATESLKAVVRLDRDRRLDPQVYAPKVIALFEEARAEVAREPAMTATETPRPPAAPASPAATAPKKGRSKTVPILLGAAGAAAAGIAVAAGGGSGTQPGATPAPGPTPTPAVLGPEDIVFLGSTPPPGSTLSLGLGRRFITMTLSVVLSRDVQDHVFHIDFDGPGHPMFTNSSCVTWASPSFSFVPGQTRTFNLDVVASPETFRDRGCPLPFTTARVGVHIEPRSLGQSHSPTVLERFFSIEYTFVP